MPKQFITNGPAGQLTRNVDTTPEQLGEMIAQVVLPAVAEMIDEKLKAAGIKPGDKPQGDSVANSYTPPSDDDFDTLPDGDSPKPGSNGRRMPPPAGDDFELPD